MLTQAINTLLLSIHLFQISSKPIQMKSFRILSVVALTFLSSAVFAQSKTDKIKVLGNCGTCKHKIETSLKVPGVTSAEWDKASKVLTVSYDEAKINNKQIQKKVAAVGYDTEIFKAKDKVYNKLHNCCKYDRTGKTSETH
ncbi:Zinc-transporting ATPase [compost metagenome]